MKFQWSDDKAHELQSWIDEHGSFRNVPKAIDISRNVVNIRTDKSLSLAPGRFTLRLADRYTGGVSYARFIQPNDVILIEINGGNQGDILTPVMVGAVVRVSISTNVAGENVSHYVEVEGQDLARWLYATRVMYWAYANVGSTSGIKELAQRKLLLIPEQGLRPGPPSVALLRNILFNFIGKITFNYK